MDKLILFSQVVEGFILSRKVEGLSPETIRIDEYSLRKLQAYLYDPPFSTITLDDLRKFIAYLRDEYVPQRAGGDNSPLAPGSIERAWSTIKALFGWANRELGFLRPDIGLTRPRYKREQVQPFTQEQVKALLDAAAYTKEAKTETRKAFRMKRSTGNRDTAIILMLLDTGMRVSEMCRLTIADVDLATGTVNIKPFRASLKSRPRVVFIGSTARKALWRYYLDREHNYETNDPVFVTGNNHDMDRSEVRHMLVNLGERAGVPGCHPHRFRHTFAIEYLRNKGDVFTLQRLLGHSTLEMVKGYVAIVDTDAKEAHRKASPADRWRL